MEGESKEKTEGEELPPETSTEETEGEEEAAVEEEKEEAEEAEEEAEREELEEDIVEERFYVVPLSKAWTSPRRKRTPRAIRILRSFIKRHMKTENVVITNEVNERIWSRGIEKPPRKIRVRVVRDSEGVVRVHLAEG